MKKAADSFRAPSPWRFPLADVRLPSVMPAWLFGAVAGAALALGAELMRQAGFVGPELFVLPLFGLGLLTLVGGPRAGFSACSLVAIICVLPMLYSGATPDHGRVWIAADLLVAAIVALSVRLGHGERRRVRRELAAHAHASSAEARFASLCEALPLGVFVADADGVCRESNARFLELVGVQEGDALGDSLTANIHSDERLGVCDEWRQSIAARQPFASEHRVQRRRMRATTVRVYAVPVEGHGYVGTVEDVTPLKKTEDQLRDAERRLNAITDHMPAIITYIDREERYQFVNRAFEKAYSRKRRETIGLPLADVLGPEGMAGARPLLDRAALGETVYGERSVTMADGKRSWLESSIVPHRAPDGSIVGYFAMSVDITARKQAEEALSREKERAEVTLGSIADAVVTTDADGCVDYMNPAAERLCGTNLHAARGLPIAGLLPLGPVASAPHPVDVMLAKGRSTGETWMESTLARESQSALPIDICVAPLRGPGGVIRGAVVAFRDASDARLRARELRRAAYRDSLTGLYNRRGFEYRLEQALAKPGTHAVLFMDLDRFKAVNDTGGHAAGDAMLKEIAGRLFKSVRPNDVVARMGGDEFSAIVADCTAQRAAEIAERMRASVSAIELAFEGHVHTVGISIGVVPADGERMDAKDVMAAADAACYAAKAAGRDRVVAVPAPQDVLERAIATGGVVRLRPSAAPVAPSRSVRALPHSA